MKVIPTYHTSHVYITYFGGCYYVFDMNVTIGIRTDGTEKHRQIFKSRNRVKTQTFVDSTGCDTITFSPEAWGGN